MTSMNMKKITDNISEECKIITYLSDGQLSNRAHRRITKCQLADTQGQITIKSTRQLVKSVSVDHVVGELTSWRVELMVI